MSNSNTENSQIEKLPFQHEQLGCLSNEREKSGNRMNFLNVTMEFLLKSFFYRDEAMPV